MSSGESEGDPTNTASVPARSPSARGSQRPVRRKGSEWEMLSDFEQVQNSSASTVPVRPVKYEGFLAKRRKWPLKGWHKRFFSLDSGVLTYGKTGVDIHRGRAHGRIDVGSAVITAKSDQQRIDIDDEECIHHLKANSAKEFSQWRQMLEDHRHYQQHQQMIAFSSSTSPGADFEQQGFGSLSPASSLPRGLRGPGPASGPGSRSAWTSEWNRFDDNMTRQLLNVQQLTLQLALLAQKIEDEQNEAVGGGTGGRSKKLFLLRKKKSNAAANSGTATLPSVDPLLLLSNATATAAGSAVSSRSSTLTSEKLSCTGTPSTDESHTPGTESTPLLAGTPDSQSTLSATSSTATFESGIESNISSQSQRPLSLPVDSGTLKAHGKHNLGPTLSDATREEILSTVQNLQSDVSSLVRSFTADKDKLKGALDANFAELHSMQQNSAAAKSATLTSVSGGNMAQIISLKHSLNMAVRQNTLLRDRLHKIKLDADIGDLPPIPLVPNADTLSRNAGGGFNTLTYSSSCSEFFDAREYNTDASDSSEDELDSEEDENVTSEDEDLPFEDPMALTAAAGAASPVKKGASTAAALRMSTQDQSSSSSPGTLESSTSIMRRSQLPVPKMDTEGINLWKLLTKNIGKDLSKISMPVTLNEPLSALQRLAEELEYSELLDRASASSEPLERMTLIAAFAVSLYGSCQARAGHKPFNPLLGETYETIREDRGFRYVAEQVSHHPPVSAAHASSLAGHWTWEQDIRVKTKFWGKSMEFQPEGVIRVELNLANGGSERYEFNKITTCIHNLFGGSDRWVDLYGDCVIKSPTLNTKMTFRKASYWSNERHEVQGSIMDKNGKTLQHLFGKWSEALYCGRAPSAKVIWRPAMLPTDSHLYYGFSRFAIELNDILESEKKLLPSTDARFRPDQRLLEEGQITEAENMKLRLEQAQRERRAKMEERGHAHTPLWFDKEQGTDGQECWILRKTDNGYWSQRLSPGAFQSRKALPKLW